MNNATGSYAGTLLALSLVAFGCDDGQEPVPNPSRAEVSAAVAQLSAAPASPALKLAWAITGRTLDAESPEVVEVVRKLDIVAERCEGVDRESMAASIFDLFDRSNSRGYPIGLEGLLDTALTVSGDDYQDFLGEDGNCIRTLTTLTELLLSSKGV